jgi:hypothetical protein
VVLVAEVQEALMARRRTFGCSRFDVAEAYYVFAMRHHRGQGSSEYRIFGRLQKMGFKPRPSLSAPKDLEPCAKRVYDRLVRSR